MKKRRFPKSLSGEDISRALQRAGFEKASQSGSHLKLKHPDGHVVIVPMHREVATGTLRSIVRQSKLTLEEFIELFE